MLVALSWLCPSADLQSELDNGASIAALRRFNDNLSSLPADTWGERSGRGRAGRHVGAWFEAECVFARLVLRALRSRVMCWLTSNGPPPAAPHHYPTMPPCAAWVQPSACAP